MTQCLSKQYWDAYTLTVNGSGKKYISAKKDLDLLLHNSPDTEWYQDMKDDHESAEDWI